MEDSILKLADMREKLDAKEVAHLSDHAILSRDGVRRYDEEKTGHRQSFAVDTDRILHSRAYTRYIDKTQVFYMVRNDHITHRVLHVQLVSKIARTIGRFLGLNEDLIESIALAHDIGHPPFGHDGESILNELCQSHGLPSFQHNLQSVIFLDRIEKRGAGCNLTLQTLDGILCHDGEIHSHDLHPKRGKTFTDFDREMQEKANNPQSELVPMSLEGCVVRFADTIAYIGRDIEDAIELKIISRDDIPDDCQKNLGRSNGTIVYALVTDLIANGIEDDGIQFSSRVSDSLKKLKSFNYKRIYLNPLIKQGLDKIQNAYTILFEIFLDQITGDKRHSTVLEKYLGGFKSEYLQTMTAPAIVRDFLAGMTDDFFLAQAVYHGCEIPEKS